MKKIFLTAMCLLLLVSAGACSVNGIDFESFGKNISTISDVNAMRSEIEKIVQSSDGISELKVDNTAGNVEVLQAGSENISISFEKVVQGNDNDAKREVMDNIKIVAEKKGDTLTVKAVARDNENTDLWKWVNSKYPSINVKINYTISVPRMRKYNIDMKAGNIKLQEVDGEIAVASNAGNVELLGVALRGKSKIKLNAGNINLDCTKAAAESIIAECNAGNISISMPGDSALDLELGVTAGNITGTMLSKQVLGKGKIKDKVNGGGIELKSTVNAGNITVNKK